MIPKYKQIKKQSWQDIFFIAFFGVLILGVVGFLVVSNFRISQKRATLDSQIERLKEDIRQVEEKKRQLGAQINQSSSEVYLEKEARERLNLKKPGEEVVTVLPSPEENKPEQTEKPKHWWNPLGW